MKTKSLTTIRSLAIGVVLVCAPLTQACSENQQSAEEAGAAKLKQAQAQAAADKLAAEKAEKDRLAAEAEKARQVAEAKAAEARKAVEDAKAAQKAAGAVPATDVKAEPIKMADASGATKPAASAEEKPEFTDAFMNSEANIAAGEDLWKQCRHCHGAKAYPGKAPKLKPVKYKPGFVFSRITKGYRKMPPWKDVFSLEQRMQLVAYIKSKQFSP
jgi:mono/diheme cytochrome c family protein